MALSDVCTRLTFAIFDGEEKLESANQLSTDNGFGTAHVSLDEGEYRLVVIAHNGKGNCSISAPEKVKFASNKLTDTFYYYGRLSVTADGATSDINLRRAVGAFKVHITDETIPEEIRSIKFYYTGGQQHPGCNHRIRLREQPSDREFQYERWRQRLYRLHLPT